MTAPYELNHFLDAQEDSYDTALLELQQGEKQSHWMWYIFPQLRGLGFSPMAHRYGLADLDHALAYWNNEVLGTRLRNCVDVVNALEGRTALQIFAMPDTLKFRSCVTLFDRATRDPIFTHALAKYYEGEADPETLRLL
ncbi:MAG: DUF1810 domain-containing protein [Hyphomonadaceae bacterium]